MHKYILRRLVYPIPTLLGVTIIVFVALRLLPGDPISVLYGDTGKANMTEVDIQAIKTQLGLDKPLYWQYGVWLKDIGTGKMGLWSRNSPIGRSR